MSEPFILRRIKIKLTAIKPRTTPKNVSHKIIARFESVRDARTRRLLARFHADSARFCGNLSRLRCLNPFVEPFRVFLCLVRACQIMSIIPGLTMAVVGIKPYIRQLEEGKTQDSELATAFETMLQNVLQVKNELLRHRQFDKILHKVIESVLK